ncbi:MAG: ABC transporter permease [Vicinamibacterales bacterium]
MLQDLRLAVRMLGHSKSWTAVIVISLALGIGANTAIFTAANGLLFRSVPVPDPGSLVRLRGAGDNDASTYSSDYGFNGTDADGRRIRATVSYPVYQEFVANNQTMTGLVATAPVGQLNVVVGGRADLAEGFVASGNYFDVLGVQALRGRTFAAEDDQPSAEPVAVVSEGFWRSRLGGSPDVIGTVLTVNTVPTTIVGVTPAAFTGIQRAMDTAPEVTVPIASYHRMFPDDPEPSEGTFWWLQVVGRLKPGATAAQVQGNLGEVFRQTARSGLEAYLAGLPEEEQATSRNQNRHDVPELIVDSAARGIYEPETDDRQAVLVLSGAVVLVLLLVCANVANLLLSRASARQREVAVRLSMGATRTRLVRQLLTESLLLAVFGSVAGVALGLWARQLLPGIPDAGVPLDWRVLSFVAGITVSTALLFGLAPALRSTAISLNASLKDQGRSVVGTRSRLGRGLIVVQVAISIVLLIGASLFVRTVQNLRHVDVGFNARNVVMFRLAPELNRYDRERTTALYGELLDRLDAVPVVQEVGLTQQALLSGGAMVSSIFVQGRTYAPDAEDQIYLMTVSPGFTDLMQIPLVLGRRLDARDTDPEHRVAVINQAAARQYFPGENPIGRRFGSRPETSDQYEVVGVVGNAKYESLRDEAPPTMYVSYRQRPMSRAWFVLRTAGDPLGVVPALREAVRAVDPALPLENVSTQSAQIEDRLQQERLFAGAYALFGGLALIVAAVGLFGLMSYNVSRRTGELGIRMALGARPGDVRQLVLRESLVMVGIGIAGGIAAALAGGRLMTSLLYGVEPTDLPAMAAAVAVLVIVAAVAAYPPARRASRLDPMAALHEE